MKMDHQIEMGHRCALILTILCLQQDHGKFTKTFEHPSNNITEVVLNEGMKGFHTYTASMDTKEPPVRNIQNTSVFWSNKVTQLSPEIDKNSKFKRGEKLLYQEIDKKVSVDFQKCSLEGNKLLYEVKNRDGKIMKRFKQHLSRPGEANIGVIPIILANYKALEELPPEKLQELANPLSMDPLAQLWLSYHSGILKHSPKGLMIKLSKMGVIPKELLYYEDRKAPICVSFQFGMGHKSSCKVKGSVYKPIKKEEHDAPRKCVSTDQLISDQPGLVPQTGGSLTRERIWVANLAVDHYTDVHKAASPVLRNTSI